MNSTTIVRNLRGTQPYEVAASNSPALVKSRSDYVCAGSTGNQNEINQAIATANAQPNGGTVRLRIGTFTMTSPIVPKSNVHIIGEIGSVLRILGDTDIIVNDSNDLDNFVIENITFEGNNTAAQARGAIYLNGDGNPNAIDAPTITNITMRNCIVRDTTSLPIRLFGIKGKTIVTGCEFTNCLDAGFIYDEEVIFIGNHSIDSGDNGFSISRGCTKVTCTGNTVENSTLFGMWFGGFLGQAGPQNLAVTGNVVKGCGRSAIYLGGSPHNATIAGNTVDMEHTRRADEDIDGVQIYGDNTTTQYANNINVTGNTILNAPRSGVSINNAKNVSITNNLIVNTGTQYLSNGTTVITSTDETTNIGILSTHLTNENVWVDGNYIIDDRAVPYCNYDVFKIQSAASGITLGTNHSKGMRNTRNRLELVDIPVEAGTDVSLRVAGPDTNIAANLNMKGSGQFRVRGAGQVVVNNVDTGSSAATSLYLSAGANTAYTGIVAAKRLDASTTSLIAFRVLSNSTMTALDSTAPLYAQGLSGSSNAKGFAGFGGGWRTSRTSVADVNYTILLQDHLVAYTSLTAPRTATLPTAVGCTGQTYRIVDETGNAGSSNITIATTSAQTISGASTKVISTAYGTITVYSNGANWIELP